MLNRLFNLGQTAVENGSRAMRLLLDLAMLASDQIRQRIGLGAASAEGPETRPIPAPEPPPPPPPSAPAAEPREAEPAPAPAEPRQAPADSQSAPPADESSETAPARQASSSRTAAAPKARPKQAKAGASKGRSPKKRAVTQKGQRSSRQRPDQMIRVLEILDASDGAWMSAKEISDAGEAAGKPILPGNVRKVIRARGKDLVETRPRKGSRRGAMEYRITAAGRARLKAE